MATGGHSVVYRRHPAEEAFRYQPLKLLAAGAGRPALLSHAIQMMDWAGAFAQHLRVRDGGADVGLREQSRFRESAIQSQVACHRGCERAAGAVG